MPRGRPRKSLEQHLRDGTYRRDRHGPLPHEVAAEEAAHAAKQKAQGKAEAVPQQAPKESRGADSQSSAEEAELRKELESLLGLTLTDRDRHMLDELCWWWVELGRIRDQLKVMIPGQKGYKDVLSSAGAALDRVIKITERFGLTPADRAKLGVVSNGPPVAKVPVRPRTKLDKEGPPKKR